jgi:aquaglyceroporin related protein
MGTNRTNRTNTGGLTDAGDRVERIQEPTVDIQDDYFTLNPWYNQQKAKPVFGLAAPLPRTVRKGMWWGRGDMKKSLYKVDEDEQDADGIDRNDALDFQKDIGSWTNLIQQDNHLTLAGDFDIDSNSTQVAPAHHGSQGSNAPDPELIRTTIEGRKVNMRRVPTAEATRLQSQDSHAPTHQTSHQSSHIADPDSQNRAPVNEHGLTYNNQNPHEGNQDNSRHQFGLADGLPPLQELDSHKTSDSAKEEKEAKKREHAAEQEYYNQYRNPIARLRAQYPQAPAEFLATFIYLFLGLCVNLSVATSGSTTGSFETQAWGWGFAVMIGIYLAGGVSGAHLSPTISISLTVYRGFPWRMAIVYIAVQMLAGLCAGALAYGLYYDAIMAVDPGLTLDLTGKALFPKGPSFSTAGGFFNDFVYMAIWVCVAFALGDDQNSPPGQGMTALIFGLNGFLTMVALGYNTGLGISPARDLGPRLVGLWAGYDSAFESGYWAYGPWGASIAGALFGGLIYDLFIFVGGESPVNYRWPQPGDIKWRAKKTKDEVKDKIQRMA